MNKFLRSIFVVTLIVSTFLLQPCYALGLLSVNPQLLPSPPINYLYQDTMGPVKVVCSPHHSIFPSEENLRSIIFLTLRQSSNEGETLPVRKINVRLTSQHLPPIVRIDNPTNKHTPSGSVLRRQGIGELQTPRRSVGSKDASPIILHGEASHLFEPDYSSVGGQSYAYGQQGNLESDGIHTFGYDVENRLITAQDATRTTHYEYDGFGRRIAKTVDGTTYFIYDGDQVIEERNELGALAKDYIYGSGIDEILSSTRYAPNTIRSFYFYDGLGSVTDITQANGEVVESYSYDVFGKASIKSQSGQAIPASAIGNRFMFTGREYDSETGLYHYRSRVYSPTIGRFLQRDEWPGELTDPSSMVNKYIYCQNNPINWIDPFGWDKEEPKTDIDEMLERLGLIWSALSKGEWEALWYDISEQLSRPFTKDQLEVLIIASINPASSVRGAAARAGNAKIFRSTSKSLFRELSGMRYISKMKEVIIKTGKEPKWLKILRIIFTKGKELPVTKIRIPGK